jgi:hypothetical protein
MAVPVTLAVAGKSDFNPLFQGGLDRMFSHPPAAITML